MQNKIRGIVWCKGLFNLFSLLTRILVSAFAVLEFIVGNFLIAQLLVDSFPQPMFILQNVLAKSQNWEFSMISH